MRSCKLSEDWDAEFELDCSKDITTVSNRDRKEEIELDDFESFHIRKISNQE